MASTKDKNGEHVEKNIPQDGGGFDYRTLKQITDIHQKQKAGGDPFEGYTAETLQKITVDGKPVYVDIETDPDTGKIINARISDEAQAHIDELAQHIAGISKSLTDAIPPETIKKMQQNIKSATEGIKRIINSFNTEKWRTFVDEFIKEYQPKSDLLHEVYDELEPFIKKELEKPEYNGVTFDGLLDQYDNISVFYDEANNPDSLLYKVLQAARAAKAAQLPTIDTHAANKLNNPVDRFNFLAWNNFEETGGQIRFNMMSEKDKRNPARNTLNISMLYSLSFADDPNIKMTKSLQHYDRRVMQAIDTLFTEYNDNGQPVVVLIGDIHRAMGNTGEPNTTQRDRLNSSLTKQGTARIYLNNKSEATAYNYPEIHYDGNILDFERIHVIYNGQEVTAIRILRRPVAMEFADQRKQMSAVPLKVLQSGIRQTNNHLQIEDYLIYRILREKNDLKPLLEAQTKKYTLDRQKKINRARKLTISLQTFHENIDTANKSKTQRDRAEETAREYLNHYKACNWIFDYKIKDGNIIITLPAN